MRLPLLGALLLLLAAALAVALVPAGLALDRRVAGELRRAAVEDLGRAPMILEDRSEARAEALSMHAMTVAGAEGLVDAVAGGRLDEAAELARRTAGMYGEQPVLVAGDGRQVAGPRVDPATLAGLRGGGSVLEYIYEDGMPHAVAVVGLEGEDGWLGAAGASSPLDMDLATALSSLARADVTIVGPDGAIVASTLDSAHAQALAAWEAGGPTLPSGEKVSEINALGEPVWVARGDLEEAATVLFSRSVERELSALPAVRRGAVLAGLLTLALAMGVGSLVAMALTRPVTGLAAAAARAADGDFDSPIPDSRVDEIHRLGVAFRAMRERLSLRLQELARANSALEERQERLHALQAELIRRDRVASSARMAAELAHEIRNPVANVRNCLEVVRRGLPPGGEGARFADMAIDELLRMHELAEHLLDLHRPGDPAVGECDALDVARQVAALAGVGGTPVRVEVVEDGVGTARAAIPPDALKQILFNLVENAREAAGDGEAVHIVVTADERRVTVEVLDEGPGIDEEVLPQVFDPFFTTKDAVSGVGLGLSVAHGLATRYGGRIDAANRPDRSGASFRVELARASREGP